MTLSLPTSEADATIVSAAFLDGADKASVVTRAVSWRAGAELAGRGSTLKVPVLSRATISDYDPANGVQFSAVEDDAVEIQMNYAKSWGKTIDLTRENAGAGSYLAEVGRGAGVDMAYVIDQTVLGIVADTDGVITSVTSNFSNEGELFKMVCDLREALADKGPITVFVPTAGINNGLKDVRFVAQGQAGASDGNILRALGVTLIETNAGPEGVCIAFAGADAIAGGTSLNATDTTFRPDPFKRTASGLCVFGASVIRPDHVAVVGFSGS